MNAGDIITFDAKKSLTYIKKLGSGGTGETHLFKDETTDMLFAVKKYSPQDVQFIDEDYARFVDEIKILLNVSHPNIVRIYNYYLYPQVKTGFIQMDYVEGKSIDQYDPMPWDKSWNEIFTETIGAFEYLEKCNILHRDVRPANILIDSECNIKIIDFGFGKKLTGTADEENSIVLNWPATNMPNEVELNHEYDVRTEIYFVGTLFRHILGDDNEDFRFNHIIEKMTKIKPELRYDSFSSVSEDISAGVLGEIDFSENQKRCYRQFADALTSHIGSLKSEFSPGKEISQTILEMAELIRTSALEEYLQDNSKLISCFVTQGYTYKPKTDIRIDVVSDFYKLVTTMDNAKRKIVFNNIYTRLTAIKVELDVSDLPF